ncbi:hypothetical protein P9112_003830 [Eukaryota sp. TZLM1-RC]
MFWRNRIVFSIFKGVVPLLSSALLSLGRFYEGKTFVNSFWLIWDMNIEKKILTVLKNLDYIVRLSLAKEKNPVFANFLIDLEDSCSSCLISQLPNIYGLLLNDHQWTTAMRMRCFLWPCSLPNDLICRCKSVVTLSHILNCKYFITYCSIVHDSVRDQLYAMCKSFNIEAFIEPLVRKLSSDQTDDSFGKRRADLVAPGIDGVLNVVDVVSVDVCKNSAARLVYSADSPLSNAEKREQNNMKNHWHN